MANRSTYLAKYTTSSPTWTTGFQVASVDFSTIQKTSDGNFIALVKGGFAKINSSTGAIMWTSTIKSGGLIGAWVVNKDDTIVYNGQKVRYGYSYYDYLGWIDANGVEQSNLTILNSEYPNINVNTPLCFDFAGGVFYTGGSDVNKTLTRFYNGEKSWDWSWTTHKNTLQVVWYNIHTKTYLLFYKNTANADNNYYFACSPSGGIKWQQSCNSYSYITPYSFGDQKCLMSVLPKNGTTQLWNVDVDDGSHSTIATTTYTTQNSVYCYYPDGSIQWFYKRSDGKYLFYPYDGTWHSIDLTSDTASTTITESVQKHIYKVGGESYAYLIFYNNTATYSVTVKKIKLSDNSTMWNYTVPNLTTSNNINSIKMFYCGADKILIKWYTISGTQWYTAYGSYLTICLSQEDGTLIGASQSSTAINYARLPVSS
jgi:hypothetical protein